MEADCWKRFWIHFTVTFIVSCIVRTEGATTAITSDIYNHLFNDSYRPELAPVCELGKNVELELDLGLRQIISLEEKAQILQTNTWIRLKWPDCRLTWNASDYGGVDSIIVPYGSIWTPDLALYDSSAEEEMMPGKDQYRAKIHSSGNVSYNFPTVLTSICRVMVAYFPFDTQNCSLQFGSWSHSRSDIDINSKAEVGTNGDLGIFVTNNEWQITHLTAVKHVVQYLDGEYPDVVYSIIMKRRPEFYVMTMLFPCILVSAIATIGFLLPAESGEKVSLEVTVLLSLAVFLLVISDFLPPSAEEFPIIGTYFAVAMVLVSISLALSVLVLNVHHRGENGKRVPGWVRKVFLEWIGQMCVKKKRKYTTGNCLESGHCNSSNNTFRKFEMPEGLDKNSGNDVGRGNSLNMQDSFTSEFGRAFGEQVEALQKLIGHLEAQEQQNERCEEWRALARIIDRVMLLIYVVLSVIVTLAFLLPLNSGEHE